jgi:hypothetical protein
MSSSVSYFRGAPITYCLCSTLFLGTLFTSLWERLYAQLSLESAQQVLSYRSELWRLLTSSMLLSDNLIAAGVTCFLLFQLRFFERQMGSSKFGAYVTLFTLLDMASRAGMLAIPGLGEHGVASGPFHLVFGLIPLYIRACSAPPPPPTRTHVPHALLCARLTSHPHPLLLPSWQALCLCSTLMP